jgi:ABC-type transport system substrate-binding protein
MTIIKRLTLLLLISVLLLGLMPARGEGADMSRGDLTIGYLAASGARINPFFCTERDMLSINALVFESLFELDENMKPQGVLADDWAQDGKTWVIRIRSGISCHNGIELVAQDVVDSYNAFLSAGEKNPYRGRLSLISSMAATDSFEVTVTGKYPGMITLYALTFPVVQRGSILSDLPMGSGPYWYVGQIPDQAVRLEANPFWWKKQPEVRSIVFRHYWDVADELSALQSGEIDLFQTRSTSAALTKKLSYATSLDYATTTYEMLAPNLGGLLEDLRLRRAVMYAIDYNTLISNVYLDMAQQCEVPIQPGSWLYESRSAVYQYSPERALGDLYAAGWADQTGTGLLSKVEDGMLRYITLEIITYNDAASNVRGNAAEQIAKNLRAVGIDASATILTKDELSKRLKRKDFDLALLAVNLSETPNLVPLLAKDGAVNYADVNAEALNNLLIQTLSAATEAEIKGAFSDLQLHLVENLPIMGLCFRTGMALSTRPLAGFAGARESDAFSGMEFLPK